MVLRVTNIKGLDLYNNPLNQVDGALIKSVNVDSTINGAKTKRLGYDTFLDASQASKVTRLWGFEKNDGTTTFQYLYRASGSVVEYWDVNGTFTEWQIAGNGTISSGGTPGFAVLNNVMIMGDGVGSTRHTTDGTTFVDTTGAPISDSFAEFQGRVYVGGTSNFLTASTPADATNWSSTGTSSSFDLFIPGKGKIFELMPSDARLYIHKTSQEIFKWDGDSLNPMNTDLAPSAKNSLAEVEGYHFWFNRLGHYGFDLNAPQLLSNPIAPQISNLDDTGIAGSRFSDIPGVTYKFDYLASVGTTTDNFTSEQIVNNVIKYNYQKNEYGNYQLAKDPRSFTTYVDSSGIERLIFGDDDGQVYTLNSGYDDNGTPITSEIQGFLHFGAPDIEKEFTWITAHFNPGNQAQLAVAVSDVYTKNSKNWMDVGDCSSGVVRFRFPATTNNRGYFLFWKVYESSKLFPFTFYGLTIDFEYVEK